jgi:hypothetical protein
MLSGGVWSAMRSADPKILNEARFRHDLIGMDTRLAASDVTHSRVDLFGCPRVSAFREFRGQELQGGLEQPMRDD